MGEDLIYWLVYFALLHITTNAFYQIANVFIFSLFENISLFWKTQQHLRIMNSVMTMKYCDIFFIYYFLCNIFSGYNNNNAVDKISFVFEFLNKNKCFL